MNKIEVKIHNEKDHSWCEVYGKFIYGKNNEEVSAALDALFMNEPDFFNSQREKEDLVLVTGQSIPDLKVSKH